MANSLQKVITMALISAALLSMAKLYVPILGLIALAPFFVVLKSSLDGQLKPIVWLLLSTLTFTLVLVTWRIPAYPDVHDIISIIFYSFTLTLGISLFLLTDKFSKNKLGLFTIIFFWLGYDYLTLKLYPQCSLLFMANIFDGSQLVNWSRYTGFMGITVWILIANLLFYYVFFKDNAILRGQIRWISLTYSLIIVLIPIVISIIFLEETKPITWQEMTDLYVKGIQGNTTYTESGEWQGRTATWVSVLLLIYSLVKHKVK